MTLTIPTAELVGAIADVAPMAWPDVDIPALNVVRFEWDGDVLHTYGTDRYRLGWSRWSPDDAPIADRPVQEDLLTDWGSADEPWAVSVRLDDALHLAKVFTLPAKEGRVPLEVDVAPGRLTVRRRAGVSAHPAYTAVAETLVPANWPNVDDTLGRASTLDKVQTVIFNAGYLADFAKVRNHGPLELSFTGETSLCHVQIGTRFTGAITPQRPDTETRTADVSPDLALLRQATELVVTTGHASTGLLQRRLKLSGGRAADLLDQLADAGVVGSYEGTDFRDVLASHRDLPTVLSGLDTPTPPQNATLDDATDNDDEPGSGDGG